VYASRTRKEVIIIIIIIIIITIIMQRLTRRVSVIRMTNRRRIQAKAVKRKVTDLAGSLVTSSRSPGRPQKRPDDRTSNAGVAVRTADGSRRTADAGDEQCLRCGRISEKFLSASLLAWHKKLQG